MLLYQAPEKSDPLSLIFHLEMGVGTQISTCPQGPAKDQGEDIHKGKPQVSGTTDRMGYRHSLVHKGPG